MTRTAGAECKDVKDNLTFTLDEAVTRAREIERMLAHGTLTVPYPAPIRAELVECVRVFSEWATTPERLKELAGRLDAPDLPW